MRILLIRLSLITLVLCIVAVAQPYRDLVSPVQRSKSVVIVRQIDIPTLANLDYAAYDRNPLLFDKTQQPSKKRAAQQVLAKVTFDGAISNCVTTIRETPLSETEMNRPMAWKPLVKRIWNVVKDESLRQRGNAISGWKWTDSTVYQPYQEISAVYLHAVQTTPEFWVRIEFAPFADFLQIGSDEDADGIKEMYGKLSLEGIVKDSLSKVIDWIANVYTNNVLTMQDAVDWVTDLASYWYPTKNTDIVDLGKENIWPLPQTRKMVRKQIGDIVVAKPLAVIEGKPFDPQKPLYNVFVIKNATVVNAPSKKIPQEVLSDKKVTNSIGSMFSPAFLKNNQNFSEEIMRYGNYAQWNEKNMPFLHALKKAAAALPTDQMAFSGEDGWLFFRKSIDYIIGGDLSLQREDKNPVVHVVTLNNYLKSKGIDFLFVAVPNKEDVYYDKIDSVLPSIPIVNAYGRKILADLQQTGVEVIDLLPVYLKEKEKNSSDSVLLYQKQDTHWNTRGLLLAAQLISKRVRDYPWYQSYEGIHYTCNDTMIERLGDLVERLPTAEQSLYKPVSMPARRVLLSDGSAFNGNNPDAPILLMGDSFTGVFEWIDCKSAGVGANLAAKCERPVDIITSWGGGPMVRQRMMRMRGAKLAQKRLIVYMMTARDLYNYSSGWESLKER